MATLPLPDPDLGDAHAADAIETVIVPRLRDIGAFEVRRALPAAADLGGRPLRDGFDPFAFDALVFALFAMLPA